MDAVERRLKHKSIRWVAFTAKDVNGRGGHLKD